MYPPGISKGRETEGCKTYSDDSIYEGEFKDGRFRGQGVQANAVKRWLLFMLCLWPALVNANVMHLLLLGFRRD